MSTKKLNYFLIFNAELIKLIIFFDSLKSKLTALSIKLPILFVVICTSIISVSNIADVIGATIFWQWFEYPLNSWIFSKFTSSSLHGYIGTQYNHLIPS